MATLAIKLHKTKRAEDRAKRINAAKLKVPEIKVVFQLELKKDYGENLAEEAEEAAARPEDIIYHLDDAPGWIQQWKQAC